MESSPHSARTTSSREQLEARKIMKRLYLSSTDKKLAGVCGGIAEYMDTDPTIVRVLTVLLGLITGVVPFFLGYVIAWIMVPRKP